MKSIQKFSTGTRFFVEILSAFLLGMWVMTIDFDLKKVEESKTVIVVENDVKVLSTDVEYVTKINHYAELIANNCVSEAVRSDLAILRTVNLSWAEDEVSNAGMPVLSSPIGNEYLRLRPPRSDMCKYDTS